MIHVLAHAWVTWFPLGPSLPPVPQENLWGLVEWGFYWPVGCPSWHPAVCQGTQGTQSTNPNERTGLASAFHPQLFTWWKGVVSFMAACYQFNIVNVIGLLL